MSADARRPIRLRILGIGMGPRHLTAEVADALRGVDLVLAADKGGGSHDALLEVRRAVCRQFGIELVVVPDPPRDRSEHRTSAAYENAVRTWHDARTLAYEQVLVGHSAPSVGEAAPRPLTAALLVWGDPSLYDSSIRIVEAIARRGVLDVDYDVLPGISAPQLLAARHRIVLHDLGSPVLVTTVRRLDEAVAAGSENIVVMLGELDADRLAQLRDWSIWWGANLATDSEELVSGQVADVAADLVTARRRARDAAGWVLDLCLLRRNPAAVTRAGGPG